MIKEKQEKVIRKKDFLFGQVKRAYVPSKLYLFMRKDRLNSIVELLNKYAWHNIVKIAKLTKEESSDFMMRLYEFEAYEFIRDTDEQDIPRVERYLLDGGYITRYVKCTRSFYFFHTWELVERYEKAFQSICKRLKSAGFIFGFEKVLTDRSRVSFSISLVGSYDYTPKQSEVLTEVLFELHFEEYIIF